MKTQFPFSYYYLPVCGQEKYKDAEVRHELGEILTGDIEYSTLYEPMMMNNIFCQVACEKPIHKFEDTVLKWMIDQEYTSSWYADGLPAGLNQTYKNVALSHSVIHENGIPIGEKLGVQSTMKVFNHFTFNIYVHKHKSHTKGKEEYSVVEFNIVPYR